MTVVTIVLLVGYLTTVNDNPTDFHVPLWLVVLPSLYVLFFSASVLKNVNDVLESEKLEYQLSGMTKKEYINFKVGDDRLKSSFAGSVFTTGLLSGASVLGPFIRGDAR